MIWGWLVSLGRRGSTSRPNPSDRPLSTPGVAYLTPLYLYYVETGGPRLSRTQRRIALVFWEAWSRMQGVTNASFQPGPETSRSHVCSWPEIPTATTTCSHCLSSGSSYPCVVPTGGSYRLGVALGSLGGFAALGWGTRE